MRCKMREPIEEESDKNSSGSDDQEDQTSVVMAGNVSTIKKPKGRRVVQ